MKIEKTVFISYRRTNIGYALAIFQYLDSHGYDVFFDYNGINSGDFAQVILNNIDSRAHFVVLLTPSALERLHEPNDWLRREIEYAIETKRNIVPLTMENFDWSAADSYLTGKLAVLSSYNALRVPADFFQEAMARLCERYLNIPLASVLQPRQPIADHAADQAHVAAQAQAPVQETTLTAQEYFEQAYKSDDPHRKLTLYSKAIQLNPEYAIAYYNRGVVHADLGDQQSALRDYDRAIDLDSEDATAYYNRALVHESLGDQQSALRDYDRAIDLNPEYANAYNNRGNLHDDLGDQQLALRDYNRAIELNPEYGTAYNNRGDLHRLQGNYQQALADCKQALRIDPNHKFAHGTRAAVYIALGRYQEAIADAQRALQIDPNYSFGQRRLEEARRKLGAG